MLAFGVEEYLVEHAVKNGFSLRFTELVRSYPRNLLERSGRIGTAAGRLIDVAPQYKGFISRR